MNISGISTKSLSSTKISHKISSYYGQSVITKESSLKFNNNNNNIIEAAHKKGSGSTKNGRDSISKRRGIKVYGMQEVKEGGIIVRQLGTKFHPGSNVGLGKDYTIFALKAGIVMFECDQKRRTKVSVYDEDHPKVLAKKPPKVDNGHPTRKERRRAMYTPRAQQRENAKAINN